MVVSDNDLRQEVLEKFSTQRLVDELARRGSINYSSTVSKAAAWDKLAEALSEIRPGWNRKSAPLVDRAIEIIQELK